MQFNCDFTTYRRTTASSMRAYSGTATITSGSGYIEPLSGDLRGVLGLNEAVNAYWFMTEETDLQIADKVVISSVNYYIEQLEKQEISGRNLSRMVIITKP